MKIKPIDHNDVHKLSLADRNTLCAIYFHRCLSMSQIGRYFYCTESRFDSYIERHLNVLLEEKYIISVPYEIDNPVYFLTARGVSLVKRLVKLPTVNKFGNIPRDAMRWNAYELRMGSFLIPHQIQLNEFALAFHEKAKTKDVKYTYMDEKFNPDKNVRAIGARPDAIIELPNVTLYLENDMCTERSDRLRKKWDKYRAHINTTDYWMQRNEKPVVILFILSNTLSFRKRRNTVLVQLKQIFWIVFLINLIFILILVTSC